MTVVSNNGEDSLNLRTEFSIIKYGVEHTVRKLPKFDTALGLSFSSNHRYHVKMTFSTKKWSKAIDN